MPAAGWRSRGSDSRSGRGQSGRGDFSLAAGLESDNLAIKGAFGQVPKSVAVGWLPRRWNTTPSLIRWPGLGVRQRLRSATFPSTCWSGRAIRSRWRRRRTNRIGLGDWANNEVGTLQPVRQVAAIAGEHGATSHSDAVQAVGHIDVDFAASGLDLLSFTAHKLGGPYGIGALLARRELRLAPILHGGGQEREVRSGTLDVAAIAGFAAALEVATRNRVREEQRLRGLRKDLVASVLEAVPWAIHYGPTAERDRLPGIANIGSPAAPRRHLMLWTPRDDVHGAAARPWSRSRACTERDGYSEAGTSRSGSRRSLLDPRDVQSLSSACPKPFSAKSAAAFALEGWTLW